MHVTPSDQILAGMGAAYFAYRLWSGWGEGVIYGDGDDDVYADQHPTAFVMTALSVVFLIAVLLYIAVGGNAAKLADVVQWIWKT